MGAAATVIEACAWGAAVVVLHGGLCVDRCALSSVALLLEGDAWHTPATRGVPPAPRAFHAAASLGRTVFVFGGHAFLNGRVVKHDSLHALDVDTLTWRPAAVTRTSPRPPARDFTALAPLPNARLLLVGGLDAHEKRLGDCWLFDAASDAWTQLPPPTPGPRYGHSLTAAWSRAFLCGGETAAGPSADLWMFRPGGEGEGDAAGAWTKLDLPGPAPPPPQGSRRHVPRQLARLLWGPHLGRRLAAGADSDPAGRHSGRGAVV